MKLISGLKWVPGYVRFMLLITFAYLSVEIPFSVYLNLFMSGSTTPAATARVEEFGRLMTGIAVAVAALGYLLPKFSYSRKSFGGQIVSGGVVAAVSIGLTYGALRAYAEVSASLATNEQMQSAYIGMITRQKLATSGIGDLKPLNDNPSWRAFVATAPMAADTAKFAASMSASIQDLALEEADRSLGGSSAFREKFFGGAFDTVRQSYNDYAEGSNAFNKKMASIGKDGDREWAEYMDSLHKEFPNGIPLRGWSTAQVRGRVMERLPVSSNWNIVDKSGFMAAYWKTASAEIRKAYADKINAVLGGEGFIEPGQSFDGFLANPTIQKKLRDELARKFGFSFAPGIISPTMSAAAFEATVFQPARLSVRQDFVKMTSDPSTFDQAVAAAKGRDAYQAATLPSLAILLSLAGAALHIFKFSAYLFQAYGFARGDLSNAYGVRRFAFGGGVLASTIAIALLWGNPVTSSDGYRSIGQDGVYAMVLDKAIAVQPGMQALGGLLQNTGIWGFVSSDLPSPRPYQTSIARGSTAPISQAANAGAEMPIPTPRPEV